MKNLFYIAFIGFLHLIAQTQINGQNDDFQTFDKQNNSYSNKEKLNSHKLKICDKDISIMSYNGQTPSELQCEIYSSVLTDDFLVNDTTVTAFRGYPSIDMDDAGNFVIVWEDERNDDGDIYFQLYDSSGTKVGSNIKVNDDDSSRTQMNLSIAMDNSGNFIIVWQDDRLGNWDIYFQRFNSAGLKQGTNTKVNDDMGNRDQLVPSIAMGQRGDFIITWVDSRNSSSGSTFDIYYQRYNSIGIKLGINSMVNNVIESASVSTTSIDVDRENNFVIVWEDNRNDYGDIYFQKYDSSSIQQGINTKVNDDIENAQQSEPKITIDSEGNFVIAWVDDRDGNYDIYYQRYNFDAISLGSNMKSNDDTGTSWQFHPVIAIKSGGDFIMAWTDYRNGTGVNNADVVGQRYYSDGNKNGDNYPVASSGNYDEREPGVIANNDKIIFCWVGNHRLNQWDIYGKIVDWEWNGVTSINEEENIILDGFLLSQNYPNPFNPDTKIKWTSPVSGLQTIKIYDILGNEITTLVNEEKPAGSYEVEFDASSGITHLVSGVYFYQLKMQNYFETKKMLLIK